MPWPLRELVSFTLEAYVIVCMDPEQLFLPNFAGYIRVKIILIGVPQRRNVNMVKCDNCDKSKASDSCICIWKWKVASMMMQMQM